MSAGLITIGVITFLAGVFAANYVDPQYSQMFGSMLASALPKPYANISMPLMILGGALIVVGLVLPKKAMDIESNTRLEKKTKAEKAKIINEFLGKKETVLAVEEEALATKKAEEAKIINEFLVKREAELATKEAALEKKETELAFREEAATRIIEEALAKKEAEQAAEEKRMKEEEIRKEEELKNKKPFNIKDTLNKKLW